MSANDFMNNFDFSEENPQHCINQGLYLVEK